MEDDPPDKKKVWFKRFVIFVVAACIILLAFQFIFGLIEIIFKIDVPDKFQPLLNKSYLNTSVIWWESIPSQIVFPTLAAITDEHELEDKIPACESDGDPEICNAEFGCSGGMGLWGFVPDTWNETIDRMAEAGAYFPERCREKFYLPASEERTEAVFDPICNDLAGRWLLKTDGTGHWGTANTWWGSYWCWSK